MVLKSPTLERSSKLTVRVLFRFLLGERGDLDSDWFDEQDPLDVFGSFVMVKVSFVRE